GPEGAMTWTTRVGYSWARACPQGTPSANATKASIPSRIRKLTGTFMGGPLRSIRAASSLPHPCLWRRVERGPRSRHAALPFQFITRVATKDQVHRRKPAGGAAPALARRVKRGRSELPDAEQDCQHRQGRADREILTA